uniref:Uncharacterized protein n=1 Tax=Arundo donax TaxID=35708 RepID=A0A0A9FNI3_ARUDO
MMRMMVMMQLNLHLLHLIPENPPTLHFHTTSVSACIHNDQTSPLILLLSSSSLSHSASLHAPSAFHTNTSS